MAKEIEHKYLVSDAGFREMASESHRIAQGYLNREPERTVRVRLRDDRAFLTVKGKNRGDERLEFEYEIPFADGRAMLELCSGRVIRKTRFIVPFGGYIWEVDCFEGELKGLILAEIELSESRHDYPLPPFIGQEVTGDPRYYNSNL